jgi:patatin-related protein
MTGATPIASPQPLRHEQVPREELRLALVLNGGVSLAVWMGGAAREIDALVRARGASDELVGHRYHPILSLSQTFASVDVISGTSAGGINGACLAVSLANQNGKLGILRDLWAEQGRMDNLLRTPFRGQPTSLLRGDEYFLPELTRAMHALTSDFVATPDYSVDLTITTTLLGGATALTTDGLGQQLPQRRHGANFRFSTSHRRTAHNDFSKDNVAQTCDALGLAARCSAGFPFAFEPTFVPVETPTQGRQAPARAKIGGRPNMWRWASWAERSRAAAEYPAHADDLSRYAVDGGVLANTPTREALDAIDRRPAGAPLRRAMLLVFPHAPAYDPEGDPADRAAEAPTVAGAVGGLLGSLTSQGSLTFVEEIDEHNRRAALWRGGRRRVLDHFPLPAIYRLVASGWRFYGETRIQGAARSLSERVPRPDGWDYRRVLDAAAEGQRSWLADNLGSLPYVPNAPLVDSTRSESEAEYVWPGTSPAATGGWAWGTTVALGVADSVGEILLRAQRLVSAEHAETLRAALDVVSTQRNLMLDARDAFDDWWWHQPALAPVAPDEAYWRLRLDCYNLAMGGVPAPPPAPGVDPWASAVEALRGVDGEPLNRPQRDALSDLLGAREWLRSHTAQGGGAAGGGATLGEQTYGAVTVVVHQLTEVQELVSDLASSTNDSTLSTWALLLDHATIPGEPDGDTAERVEGRVLDRLLTLDAATWMLADAESTGTSQALKLAQLSLVIDHWWALKSKTPDDKVAGSELNRFGGFLKQSWRINDWIWGRLDAAQMLCRLVLEPARLLRVRALTGMTADEMVGLLLRASYGDAGPPPELSARCAAAVAELDELFSGASRGQGYLPELAGLAAYPIQQQIIVAELPALARAIEEDVLAGGNERSRGVALLTTEKDLFEALSDGGPDLWRTKGTAALEAFDRAGVGREPLEDEARSDALIQTAVTAAATLATVADGDRFGPKALKPVTKAVRGAALLPYWLVTGLLSGRGIARTLALLGFVVGGLALLLGLFGALGPLSSAATTVGAGVVVGAFAFAALRSGTLLHGAVLLGVAVPLVVLAGPALEAAGRDADAAQGSVVSLGTVTVIVLGLILLASLPNPVRSPVAVSTDASRAVRRSLATLRATLTVRGVLLGLLAVLVAVGLGLGVGWLVTSDESWADVVLLVAAAAGTALAVAVGAVVAQRRARGMRRWTQWTDGTWEREPRVTSPSGVSAGWAAVYGPAYLAIAWVAVGVLSLGKDDLSDASTWQLAAVAWWAVLGAVLCLAAPTWITWRERHKVAARVRKDCEQASEELDDTKLLQALESRGRLFDYMVTRNGTGTPVPTADTRELGRTRRRQREPAAYPTWGPAPEPSLDPTPSPTPDPEVASSGTNRA